MWLRLLISKLCRQSSGNVIDWKSLESAAIYIKNLGNKALAIGFPEKFVNSVFISDRDVSGKGMKSIGYFKKYESVKDDV